MQIRALGAKLAFDSEIELGNRRMRSEIDPRCLRMRQHFVGF